MKGAASTGIGILGLCLALIGFSMSGVWVRWLIALDPLALTGWRVVVALTVLVPVSFGTAAARRTSSLFVRDRRTHTTALRMTAFFIIAVIGFQRAPVALVLLCLGLSPAWVLLIMRRRGDRVSRRQVWGVGLALAGATVGLVPTMTAWFDGGDAQARDAAIGALCGLAAGTLSASYAVQRRYLRGPHGESPSAFLLAAVTSGWGLFSFPLATFSHAGVLAPRNTLEIAATVGFGLISTAAPLWGFAAASRHLPPLLVALTTPLIPFGGALAAWLLLGQVPPEAFAVGAPIVLAGIVLVLTAAPPDEN